jgi:hypothetical protein
MLRVSKYFKTIVQIYRDYIYEALLPLHSKTGCRRGRDRMVDGFTITCAISSYVTTDLSQVTDKLNHIMLFRMHLAINEVRTHNVSDDSY